MNLSCGIVGLPNAGKSTLFNALAQRRLSKTAAHPFTTIEPHEVVVPVSDENLERLADIVRKTNPGAKAVPATVTFIDIAGLVRGANEGEGLGNQFLAKIREVDAIVHIVRLFENQNVPHAEGTIEPKRDIEIVTDELKKAGIEKPTLYVLNVSESQLSKVPKIIEPSLIICAKLEEELLDLPQDEKKEYLLQLETKESGLEKLIKESYKLLKLITFYTIKGGKEVHAWSLKQDSTALDSAEKVHTDFAKHFIKAEVIPVSELLVHGSWHSAKEKGRVRLEGKDYIVKDGDVIEFKIGS